jgi:hypothetical protein
MYPATMPWPMTGSENEADICMKNLDGPLFKCYAELLLGEGAISGKEGDTNKGGCLEGISSVLSVMGCFIPVYI